MDPDVVTTIHSYMVYFSGFGLPSFGHRQNPTGRFILKILFVISLYFWASFIGDSEFCMRACTGRSLTNMILYYR